VRGIPLNTILPSANNQPNDAKNNRQPDQADFEPQDALVAGIVFMGLVIIIRVSRGFFQLYRSIKYSLSYKRIFNNNFTNLSASKLNLSHFYPVEQA
jgi:hypothetical protein